MIRTFCAVVLCFLCAGLSAESAKWQMRSRVYCNYDAGVSFRYPYEFACPDQYGGGLRRKNLIFSVPDEGDEKMDAEQIEALKQEVEELNKSVDLIVFSCAAAELPADCAGGDLAAIGNHFAAGSKLALRTSERSLTWKTYDYYQRPNDRPQASPNWAPAGIEARIGENGAACGLLVKHAGRYSGLIMTGRLGEFGNSDIIDSFEIMAGSKMKDKISTWREAQWRKGMVIDGDGRAIKADGKERSSWARAWECETRHYHVTTEVSSGSLLEYGRFLEAIYQAYVAVYMPDSVPPYKMEVHIFFDQGNFASAAAAHGFMTNPNMGGFFVPRLLAIYAFKNMPFHFSEDFTLTKVLAHECSHQFLHCTCNGSDHVPTWLNEGLAVYFESGVFENGQFSIRSPRQRVEVLQMLYAQNKHTLRPLDEYLKHYEGISAEEYGEVYAMTHFWIFGAKGGKERFKKYWTALKSGENGSEAFERIFMADMIKAQGGRDQAVAVWQKLLIEYVNKSLR